MTKLFLDDERFPVTNDWIIVRSFQEATNYVMQNGIPEIISFDHDLSEIKTGYDFALWLVEQHLDKINLFPDNFEFIVHSMNPVGAENIKQLLNNFLNNVLKSKN